MATKVIVSSHDYERTASEEELRALVEVRRAPRSAVQNGAGSGAGSAARTAAHAGAPCLGLGGRCRACVPGR